MVGRPILKSAFSLKYPDISVAVGSPAAQDRLAPVFTQPAAECAQGVVLEGSFLCHPG